MIAEVAAQLHSQVSVEQFAELNPRPQAPKPPSEPPFISQPAG